MWTANSASACSGSATNAPTPNALPQPRRAPSNVAAKTPCAIPHQGTPATPPLPRPCALQSADKGPDVIQPPPQPHPPQQNQGIQSVRELDLHAPTLGILGLHMAPQQIGLWVPQALDAQPKQLVRLKLSVGWPLRWRLRLIGEVAEVERRGRGARIVLGPSGWERLRVQLSAHLWRRADDLSHDLAAVRRPTCAPILWTAHDPTAHEPAAHRSLIPSSQHPGWLLDASAGGVFLALNPDQTPHQTAHTPTPETPQQSLPTLPFVGQKIWWRLHIEGASWFAAEARWQGHKTHPNGQDAPGVGCRLRFPDPSQRASWPHVLARLPSEPFGKRLTP